MSAALLLALLSLAPQPITDADLALQRLDDFEYTEAWYLVGEFADKGRLFLVYSVTNMGLRAFTGNVEASLLLPDGRIESEKITIGRKEISVAQSPFGMHFGREQSISLTVDQGRFQFHGERIQLNLALQATAPGYKFGDGKTRVGGDGRYFSYGIVTPRGRLTGEAVVGGKPLALNGFAYLDHSRQNAAAHKFIDRVFSFRSFSGDDSVNFFAFIGEGEVRIGGLSFTRGGSVLVAADRIAVEEKAPRPTKTGPRYVLPGALRVLPLSAEFTLTQLVQERDVLDDMSFLERKFINLFVARPMLYRYWATYEIPLPDGTIAKGTGMAEALIVRDR